MSIEPALLPRRVLAALLCAIGASAAAARDAPWRIETFCHRPVPAAQRCLVRSRQGILVFQIAELPSAPKIEWHEGIAVLANGSGEAKRLRFYTPPQTVSAAYRNVLDYDVGRRLVALATAHGVEMRSMFAPSSAAPLAALDTGGARPGSVQAKLREGRLELSWRDARDHAMSRTLEASARN